METLLSFIGIGLPDYSARGLSQTLQPIDAAASMRRTINGELMDISASQFQKYQSTIRGGDQQPPAIDGVWPGLSVNVNCMVELAVAGVDNTTSATTEPALGRPAVAGSIRTEGAFTFYRPALVMKVMDFNIDRDEWGAQVGWSMQLEEV
jgi:hypothetical protein